MKHKLITALAIAALIPTGAALAGDGDMKGDKSATHSSFKKLDTNRDGRISRAEAAADSTVVFTTADTNGDGYLDNDEWKNTRDSGSSRPQSSTPSQTDPAMPPGTEPSGNPPPDTETPRQ